MLPRIAGYGGFQSYGDLPYPSLKAGKDVLAPNDIWEKTERQEDHQKVQENYHYYNSNYHKTQVENTNPKDYKDHTHVKLGGQHSLRKTASNTLTKFDETQETSHLNSGVEHWKSNYTASIVNPYAYTKASQPEWSKHKKPHTVNSKVGPSEYITQLGELGTRPIDKLDQTGGLKRQKLDEPLKMGTTQATNHIPGYTAFIPSAYTSGKALQQAMAVEPRTVGNKISIVENTHTKIPGYAGHQPSNAINQRGQLRESCFQSYKI